MRIREYTAEDLGALRRMHAAQGFGYPFPDLGSPMFVSKLVLEDDDVDYARERSREAVDRNSLREVSSQSQPASSRDEERDVHATEASEIAEAVAAQPRDAQWGGRGRVTMAILQRLTAETYLLHDPSAGTPERRWQNFLALHDAALREAGARGLDDVQAFLPPRISRAFGRRLSRLGWTRDPWPCFSRQIP